MITKNHLHISLCAAIAVSAAFSSCSDDDNISSDDNKTNIVVISPADSIITAPFVTITNKYDLSSIKKDGKEISYSTEWSPLKCGFVERTTNKKLNDGETSSSSTYNYLQNDTQYKYVITLTSGKEQIFYKSLIYRVKFDEKNYVTTNNAVQGNEHVRRMVVPLVKRAQLLPRHLQHLLRYAARGCPEHGIRKQVRKHVAEGGVHDLPPVSFHLVVDRPGRDRVPVRAAQDVPVRFAHHAARVLEHDRGRYTAHIYV